MDVTDLVERLLRRWRATLAVAVVAVLAAGLAWSGAGSLFSSTATVVIVPPFLGDAVSDQNPMLNLDDNLAQLATVLASAMGSPEPPGGSGLTEDATGETSDDADDADDAEDDAGGDASGEATGTADGGATYTISTVTGTNPSFARLSPQLVFTVSAPSAEAAESTSRALVAEAVARLDDLQTEVGTPFQSQARLVTVVPPTPAEAAGGDGLRAASAAGVGVGVLGLLVVLLVDELLARRGERSPRSPRPPRTPLRSSRPRWPRPRRQR